MDKPSSLSGPFLSAAHTGRNEWWRYAVTLAALLGGVLLASAAVLLIIILHFGQRSLTDLPAPWMLALTLLPFGAVQLILSASLRWLHRRPFVSLVNPGRRFRWSWFALAGGAWLLLCGAVDGLQALLYPGSYHISLNVESFWPYLLVALLLFPLQTSAEELIFRAYLPQGLGLLSRRIWLPWLLPACLFASLHLANAEVGNYGFWSVMPIYLGIGLLLGWVTLRSQGLEMAFGLHLANNLYSALIVGMPGGSLSATTIFTLDQFHPLTNLVLFLVICLVAAALAEWLVQRKPAHAPAWLALLLVPPLLGACAPVASAPAGPILALQPCLLSAPGMASQVDARCATLPVPENPDDPSGRQIELRVAVIPAQSSNPAPDPLILLAGGPGQAASQAFLPLLSSLERVSFKRDLVLIDQRGTGSSAPLECPGLEEDTLIPGEIPSDAETVETLQACLAQSSADPRYYTTDVAMQDVEAVRQALGYDQVNLLGVSYGTRAALTYMRLYPQNVRTAVLDGVVPPEMAIGADLRRDAQQSMDAILARCADDPACGQAFPNLAEEFDALLQRLTVEPARVSVAHPLTGVETEVELNQQSAAGLLRMISYSSDLTTLLPWLVHTAAQGDLRPLASQYLLLTEANGASVNPLLFYSVLCSEDVPFFPTGGETAESYFYDVTNTWRTACAAFPQNPQPAAERAYPTLEIPTLFISGSADPVTPPENAAQAARYLPQSREIVLEGMGHGNFQIGCVPNLIRQLLEDGNQANLDTSCVQRSAPPPFFINSLGPQP